VPVLDGDGLEEDDNPEIYKEQSPELITRIPNWVEGIDLSICKMLMIGVRYEDSKTGTWKVRAKTYAEVAHDLHMTENSVTKRIKKIRERATKEKKEAKKYWLARWRDRLA
jgi:hypothetical protein